MPIENMNLAGSLKKESRQAFAPGIPIVNGTTFIVGVIENAMVIRDCKVMMNGVSGTPSVMLGVYRFNPGSGAMSFIIGSSFAVTSFQTSGFMTYSLPVTGTSTLNLIKGDIVMCVQGGGTGAASVSTVIDLIVENLQDIVTWY